ncbi:hypothetical protein KQH61_03630 [bacterium]|nr:hypothetical protein [bacterium]MCB2178992.1 hypothetical protein [bacterium]
MIPTLHTHEVRWFAPGTAPEPVRAWFTSLGKLLLQMPRTDRYLLGVEPTLGIKTRQGSLEVKQRSADHGEHHFHPHLAGQVESWVKWSFPLEMATTLTNLPSDNWFPVRKARQLLLYTFSAQGAIVPAPPGEFPTPSGGLELTEVQLAEKETWWTVGLELAGFPSSNQTAFLRLAEHLLQSPPDELMHAQSLSYPAWLETVR